MKSLKEMIEQEMKLADGQMDYYRNVDGKAHLYAYWHGVYSGLIQALAFARETGVEA